MYNDNYKRLLTKIRNNEVVLWVGAGFSRYAGVPTGGELVKIIQKEATKEEREILKEYNSLPEVAEEFVKMRNSNKRGREELFTILERALIFDVKKEDLSIHSLLRNIPQIRTIITTNFDTLFEKAFGDELEVIIDEESIATADSPNNRNKVKLFKVHSDFTNTDSMIITKSDYINFFSNEKDSLIWTEIRAIMAKKSILFIGYSLEDPNFQYIFDKVLARLKSSSKECFLVSPNLPVYKQGDLLNQNIFYIDASTEEFMPRLSKDIMDTLVEDCENGLVNHKIVKKIFAREGINLDYQMYNSKIYVSSVGLSDTDVEPMTLKVRFANNDELPGFTEMLRGIDDRLVGKTFEPIDMPGIFIQGIDCRLKNFNINPLYDVNPKDLKMSLKPYPEEKYRAHIYCGKDNKHEDVTYKRYRSEYLIQVEIVHECFKIIFQLPVKSGGNNGKEYIQIKIKSLRQSNLFEEQNALRLLLRWFKGERLKVFKADDYGKNFNLPDISKLKLGDKGFQDFIKSCEIQEYVLSSLIKIQKYYKVNFTIPEKITSEDVQAIDWLNMVIDNNGEVPLNSIKLDLGENTVDKLGIAAKDKEDCVFFEKNYKTLELFGTCIRLGYLHIYCIDCHIQEAKDPIATRPREDWGNSLVIKKGKLGKLYIKFNEELDKNSG